MLHPIRSLVLALPLALLMGCALQTTAPPTPVAISAGIGGTVFGGNIPITGSNIYLIAIGETGYGTPAATSILATTTTDSNGSFTLPAFSCGGRFTHTFIEARGGNPGLASGTNNSAIFLAAIPTLFCSDLNTGTHIHIDEVTTVATAYTLRPFVDGNNVGTSSTNIIGLSNAYSTYSNLVNTATGTSPGASVPSGVSVPTATINALANSLTACVNTTGPTSSACTSLFTDSGVSSTGTTANTFNIAVAIASNPQPNAADIFKQAGATPPFQPALTAAPNDWTLPVVYTSGNLGANLMGLDIDTSGNVWVAARETFSSTVEEISPGGTYLGAFTGGSGLGSIGSIAIDQNGSIVVGDVTYELARVLRFHGSTTDFITTNTDIKDPARLAIDASNNVVVGDANGNMLGLSATNGTVIYDVNAGTTNGTATYDSGTQVLGVAVDENAVYGVDDLYLSGLGVPYATYPVPGCSCPGNFVAFDSATDIYVAGGRTLYYLSANALSNLDYYPSTTAVPSSFLFYSSGGGITAMAIDGLSKIWLGVSNPAGFSVMNLNAASYSGSNFLTTSNVNYLFPATNSLSVTGLAIDGSGNVWLANGSGGGLYELVGAAAPVITPLSLAAKSVTTVSTEP